MRRFLASLAVAFLTFMIYIIFSGSVSSYDLLTACVTAALVGGLTGAFVVTEPAKAFSAVRAAYTVAYFFRYMLIDEVRAHTDVIRRILSPRMPINPGIVKVPYHVNSDYAMTLIANSITNTPGTVVVDVDKSRKYLFVHWIDVKTIEPEEARKAISCVFERYSKKIFD